MSRRMVCAACQGRRRGGRGWRGGMSLLDEPIHAVNVGVELFAETLAAQGVPVERVEWRPPLDTLDGALGRLLADAAIDGANAVAVGRLLGVRPALVDVRSAGEVIPGMTRRTLLHAGPPIAWEATCGPMRGAIVGALLYEGLADTAEEAERLAAGGEIELTPCH